MKKYLLALDQGTTSSRAILFDRDQNILAISQRELTQIYPHEGWVEQNPMEIYSSQYAVMVEVLASSGIDPNEVAAIGITNQRETTILWDRKSGLPIYNAIVWQCRRTAPLVERLKGDGLGNVIREKTGLIPDAYFSGTKLQWLLDQIPGARDRARRGELCFGTVDSFLTYHLSAGRAHVTDATNAARTMLFNIHQQEWDDLLLMAMDIPKELMPQVVDNAQVVGMLRKDILGREIPIAALAGDQHAALFGQACFAPGMVKNTYGTGCFMLMNTGTQPVRSQNNLLTTVAWRLDNEVKYALEGSVFVAGAAVQWLRDEMGLVKSAAETDQVARSIPDSANVYVVPAFTGLGAPYWDMYGRGAIIGLTRGTGRAHVVRATLESIAYQTRDVLDAMALDSGLKPTLLRVDGGASANDFLMQFQADILGSQVIRPAVIETTAMGVAMLAGRAVGLWDDKQLASLWKPARTFEPAMEQLERERLYRLWQRAVERAKGWAQE